MDHGVGCYHRAPVHVLPRIKKLDNCFGDFAVRVTCPCGTSRHIEPEALARIAGRSASSWRWRPGCGARSAGRRSPKWSRWRGRGRGGAEEYALSRWIAESSAQE